MKRALAVSAIATGALLSATLPAGAAQAADNPYTPKDVCGSGYDRLASHDVTGATIYLMWNENKGKVCVTTIKRSSIGTPTLTVAKIKIAGGDWRKDKDEFTHFAGPVGRQLDPSKCFQWGGAHKGDEWHSGWWC